jgi:RimJ/RimL family protein N-acetyltransferase
MSVDDSSATPVRANGNGAAIVTTSRLALTEFTAADAPFIVQLLNDPDWIRYIGDRDIRTDDDARAYLARGPLAMYAKNGFGLWRVARRDDGTPVGMCGLIKRDTLPDVDVGFAFLPAYRGLGYAEEAAAATLALAADRYGLTRVVAIASPDNERSLRLLEKLGMTFEGPAPGGDSTDPTVLYALNLCANADAQGAL